ncbi:hypothetical protein LOTGIDRAFT_168570 [Lottia gigantea]|uniref:Farnesoic acid O-methyl transferase domain-containing protein n=1 Tax=Lottia gigantea TaxID=225164 RepID=V3ZUT6_LOTGI|nr:hypothetical protein LOTGIDRAFT_168570 [Lottia gigantea]ESO84701.1 hypothetical protein LOTGIDRAFT_168570 [Lottia gigantea]
MDIGMWYILDTGTAIMWFISLFWMLRWIFFVHLAHRTECGRFVTTALRRASYFHNVAEQNHLIFALKSEDLPQLDLFNDTSKVGEIILGLGNNPKDVTIMLLCLYDFIEHTSDLVTPTEYTWLWIRWTGTQIEFGTGKTPGVDLVHYSLYSQDIKYIGFVKYEGHVESHWIVGQTDELANESVFKKRKNRRISDIASVHQENSKRISRQIFQQQVNGTSICELISKDLPTTDCPHPPILDWEGKVQPGWTNYYL